MTEITVFIVEDDPMVLDVNKSFLEKIGGFRLIGEAMDGHSAYSQIKLLEPKLVLLDMYLPDLSGLELLIKLRFERIPIDVIMITAARDAKTIQEIKRLGAVDYLVKPFRFDRFQKALLDYRKNRKNIVGLESMKQEDIDAWIGSIEGGAELPKGLNEITMKQVLTGLVELEHSVTAEQLALQVGMARVTVRKYLDFLANIAKVEIELKYGNVGRPTKYYSLL
ncbi:response regulator [Sporosarcina highlanderae]|uniref:Transcriptional regulatory protein n=1 Tax=Sporosarcina highlanderae TaxID=3035916 RepID=A0ABT8JMF9_9BACL|nr:response regulator [Sporosarcina highlanderae]MDN4606259.1 response regulator [Sporosarcina highlanderae]